MEVVAGWDMDYSEVRPEVGERGHHQHSLGDLRRKCAVNCDRKRQGNKTAEPPLVWPRLGGDDAMPLPTPPARLRVGARYLGKAPSQ